MSFSEKDRKVRSKSGKLLREKGGSPATFAEAVASALREQFGNTTSAVKTVAQITYTNERAVKNWFDAKNGPSGENLVALIQNSDVVFRLVLRLAGREEAAIALDVSAFRRYLVSVLAGIDGLRSTGD